MAEFFITFRAVITLDPEDYEEDSLEEVIKIEKERMYADPERLVELLDIGNAQNYGFELTPYEE